MHDIYIVFLYVCVVALTEIGVSEIWQSWGRYERNDFAAWGLAFTLDTLCANIAIWARMTSQPSEHAICRKRSISMCALHKATRRRS